MVYPWSLQTNLVMGASALLQGWHINVPIYQFAWYVPWSLRPLVLLLVGYRGTWKERGRACRGSLCSFDIAPEIVQIIILFQATLRLYNLDSTPPPESKSPSKVSPTHNVFLMGNPVTQNPFLKVSYRAYYSRTPPSEHSGQANTSLEWAVLAGPQHSAWIINGRPLRKPQRTDRTSVGRTAKPGPEGVRWRGILLYPDYTVTYYLH